MPKRIPIKAIRELAQEQGLTHVILLAHDGQRDHVVTYGKTEEQCSEAADFGNHLKDALGWPGSLHAQPSTVARLKKRIEDLEYRLQDASEEAIEERWKTPN